MNAEACGLKEGHSAQERRNRPFSGQQWVSSANGRGNRRAIRNAFEMRRLAMRSVNQVARPNAPKSQSWLPCDPVMTSFAAHRLHFLVLLSVAKSFEWYFPAGIILPSKPARATASSSRRTGSRRRSVDEVGQTHLFYRPKGRAKARPDLRPMPTFFRNNARR